MANTIIDQPTRLVPLDGDEYLVIQDPNGSTQKVTVDQVQSYTQKYTLLYSSTTQVGTDADTAEKTLASYTLPGGTLDTDGDFIEVRASGSYGSSGSAKLRLYFEGEILTTEFEAQNNKVWEIRAIIFRTGSSGQKTVCYIDSRAAQTGSVNFAAPSSLSQQANPSEDLSADILIKLTGQDFSGAFGDAVFIETFSVTHVKQS